MNNLDKNKLYVKTQMRCDSNNQVAGTWFERNENRDPIPFDTLEQANDYLLKRACELNEHNKETFRVNHGIKFYYVLKVIKNNKLIHELNSKNLKNY